MPMLFLADNPCTIRAHSVRDTHAHLFIRSQCTHGVSFFSKLIQSQAVTIACAMRNRPVTKCNMYIVFRARKLLFVHLYGHPVKTLCATGKAVYYRAQRVAIAFKMQHAKQASNTKGDALCFIHMCSPRLQLATDVCTMMPKRRFVPNSVSCVSWWAVRHLLAARVEHVLLAQSITLRFYSLHHVMLMRLGSPHLSILWARLVHGD